MHDRGKLSECDLVVFMFNPSMFCPCDGRQIRLALRRSSHASVCALYADFCGVIQENVISLTKGSHQGSYVPRKHLLSHGLNIQDLKV